MDRGEFVGIYFERMLSVFKLLMALTLLRVKLLHLMIKKAVESNINSNLFSMFYKCS